MTMNYLLWIIAVLVFVTIVLILFHHLDFGFVRDKKYKRILYSVLSIELIIVVVTLFGEPILNKIYAYRDSVLSQSEEECSKEDAPFWCNL